MAIVTRPATAEYRNNFEETFGPKAKRPNECRVYNTTCPTPALCHLDNPGAPCLAGMANDANDREPRTSFVPYPADRPPRWNGGSLCDMWIGPCACGAWHNGESDPLERR